MSEKTEKASNWKLQKAREQGQVSKSTELNTCIFLLILLITWWASWPYFFHEFQGILKNLFYLNGRVSFSIDSMIHLQQILLTNITLLWLPFALYGILSIIASTMAQTGFVWSLNPLTPDLRRLDVSKGFKRLFSSKSVFEAGKNTLKLGLAFMLLFLSLRHELPLLTGIMLTQPDYCPALFMALLAKVLLQLLLLLFALALIDKLYTRWKFAKDNRMSRQELKDEYRQREGDPNIKRKTRQLQHQLRLKTASLEQVRTADVVITNPTRLAIALKYERGLMPAPKVVCKAQGDLARQVRLLAARHQVPIIENRTFARALFATADLNQWIGREHFPVAALIFRDIFQQRTRN